MDVKKQKSIDITKPSVRRILSWKYIKKNPNNINAKGLFENLINLEKIKQILFSKNRRFLYAGIGVFLLGMAFCSYELFITFQKNKPAVDNTQLVDPYNYKIEKSDYAIDFSQIKNQKEAIKVGKVDKIKDTVEIKNGETVLTAKPAINTEIVYGNHDLKFDNANINIKKNGPVNAIIACQNWNETENKCASDWELAKDIAFNQDNNNVSFSVKHFSAYAGAYLNIINLQSNLTKGDDWTVNFRTYSQSDLKIEAVDGTNFDTDLQFENISCGDTEIPSDQIEKNGNIILVRNYQCDNETSIIKNKAVTAGRHWLAFSFGDTQNIKAHNFACDSGTLDDTCTVSSTQTMANSDTISGAGSLVVASGGNITSAAGDKFTISMTGDVTIQSGGTITGNATVTATNFLIDSGGSVTLDGKGYAGGAGPGAGSGGYGTPGGSYGGVGGYNSSSSAYGSLTAPTDLGSGGGGYGGGAIKVIASGATTIAGSISVNGTTWGGGSGGSVWISTNTLAGSGSIVANGARGDWNAGGGGGRIAITYNSISSGTLAKQAIGSYGTSTPYGGGGTIYTKSTAETYGNLYISNNGVTSGTTPLLTTGGNGGGAALWQFDNDLAGITSGGYLQIPTGVTVTMSNTSSTINGTGGITLLNGGTLSTGSSTTLSIAGTTTFTTGTFTATSLDSITVDGTFSLANAVTFPSGLDLTINNGGTLTHASNASSKTNYLDLNLNSLTVNSGGSINVDGKGYAAGNGPGVGSGYAAGSYGGIGKGNGATYGSLTAPTDLGSGGNSGGAGAGGGAVKLTVSGTATINGSVTANGSNGNNEWYQGGGGSGGSIWIIANTITGSSSITANGGNGYRSNGAGGGGRVSIQYTTDNFTGTKTTYGGTDSFGSANGGAGTIFTKSSTETHGKFFINNNAVTNGVNPTPLLTTGGNGGGAALWQFDNDLDGITNGGYLQIPTGVTFTTSGTSTTVNSGSTISLDGGTLSASSLTDLTITGTLNLNSGTLTAASSSSVTLNGTLSLANAFAFPSGVNLTINNGGVLTHAVNTDTKTNYLDLNLNSLTINSGGTISVTGKGYSADNGPGAGLSFRGWWGSGAGYGGNGASAQSAGGNAYGSLTNPSDLGSGGGSGGSAGGGAVKLTVSGTATIDGSITANAGTPANGGGGSGGSIWIIANTLAGSGSITADGGSTTNSYGGAGAGGRIAIQYTTNTFSGTKTAYGNSYAGAGTIYTKSSAQTYGNLYINNNVIATGITPLLTTGGNGGGDALWQFDNDLSGITNGGYLQIPTGVTLTLSASDFAIGSNGLVYIEGGTLSAPNATALNVATGTITLNTGTISAPSLNTDLTVTGTININGGIFTAPNATGLTLATGSTLNLNSTAFATSSLQTITLNGALSVLGSTIFSSGLDMTINNGGVLTHAVNTDTKTNYLDLNLNSFTVNSGGSINVDGKGYSGDNGPGAGLSFRGWYGSGAGYGGKGGDTDSVGGNAYGSLPQPNDLGSGGGSGGSAGGGAVKLTVSGTATIAGSITANAGTPVNGGGGSGGSIWIIANTLAGSGSITANGGSSTNSHSGSGAGGRIALYYTTDTFSGTKTAYGDSSNYYDYYDGENGTIIQDGTTPVANMTAACSVAGNGCTDSGSIASPQESYRVNNIAGSATIGESGVANVKVSIKDTDGSVNKWYNASNNSFDQGSENWLDGNAGTNWSYDTSHIVWTIGHTYQIRAKIQNGGDIWSDVESSSFTFSNSPPTVSNVTASQNATGETVAITYDVTDVESSSTTIYMLYEVGTTLNEELTSNDTTAITVSDASHFPDSGTIMIGEEMISYTSKSGNDLQGTITRGINNTVALAHSSGATVWIEATSTGGTGLGTQTNGTSKSVTWNAGTDNDEFYSNTSKIRISANDGSVGSMVGNGESADYVLDTKNPSNVSLVIDHINNRLTMATPVEESDYKMYLSNYPDFHDASPLDFTSPYTYTGLTSDPATVYLRIKDSFGNYTDVSASTPAQAQNLKFYDTSSPIDNVYQEFIVWDVVPVEQTGAGFLAYNIYQKIDGGDFTLVQSIKDREFNYYLDGNLSSASRYTYKVTVEDINHNLSDYSGTVTDIPNGTGSSDTTPPTISGVTVSNIETTSAKITWTTEELSDSSVGYSIGHTYLPERGLATLTANHEISLTGLTPNTTYNIKVKSHDIRGNLGSVCYGGDGCSPGSNNPSVFQFKTADGPEISKVRIEESSNTQATVTWETNTDSDSHVIYSNTVANGELVNPLSADISDYVGGTYPFIHEVTLGNLNKSTPYYFYVESTGTAGTATLKNITADPPYFNFLTGNDTTPPEISEPEAIIISNAQVAIYWTTDEPADSKVEYKKGSESYSDNIPETITTYDKSHYVILSNLASNTDYTFRITSKDINGNETISAENTFKTLHDPEFQHNPVAKIMDTSDTPKDLTDPVNADIFKPSILNDTTAVLKFNTFDSEDNYVNSKCQIKYRQNSMAYSDAVFALENDYNANHSMSIEGLIFSTKYFFYIECTDNLGNSIDSQEFNFTTEEKLYTETEANGLTDKTAPSISGVSVGSITGESATVTWDTNENANSFIKYGITTDYGNMAGDDKINLAIANYAKTHTVILGGLIPATKYYYTAVSYDASGNIGESSEDSFTTSSPSSLSSIKVSSTSLNEVNITWSTSSNMTSIVEYGITTSYGELKSSNTSTKDHSVQIFGLKAATTYHFRVKGKDVDNNMYSSGDYSFEPKSPPKVSGVSVSNITEHNAQISISTDIPADALVTYFEKGNDSNSGSQGKPDFATKHDINLANLKSGTTYSYSVKVSDEQGNQTTNDPKEFTTDQDVTPPVIDSVHTDNALAQSDKVQTIISCKTDEPSTASVFYREGKNGDEKELKMTTNLTTSQVAVITSFKPGTVYNFKIVATDAAGNTTTSDIFSLLTPIQKANIIQVIVNNFQDIFGWAKK